MFSFCSEWLLCAVLYSLAILCCYVGISQSLYEGWMPCEWEWLVNFFYFGPSYPSSLLSLHAQFVAFLHHKPSTLWIELSVF